MQIFWKVNGGKFLKKRSPFTKNFSKETNQKIKTSCNRAGVRDLVPAGSRHSHPPVQLYRSSALWEGARSGGPYTRGHHTGHSQQLTALLSPSLPPLLQTAGGVKKGNKKSRVCSVPFPGSPKPPCTLTTVPAASLVPPSSRSSSPTLSAVRGGSLGESGSGGGGGGDGLRAAEGSSEARSHFENWG